MSSRSGSMLLSSSIVCGMITLMSAICNTPSLPSASITIILSADSNRLGELIGSLTPSLNKLKF